MTTALHVYRYAGASGGGPGALALCGSAPDPGEESPFLEARLVHPRATADWLLTVAAIVRQRFFTPPAMRERLLLLADPVVTVSGRQVRCEGFSSCCGVYARLDLDEEALAAEQRSFGTTNVDFGEAMREALVRVRDTDDVQLRIGAHGVGIRHPGGEVFERRVELPLRWLRGFAEVQAVMAGMEHCGEVDGRDALMLLRALPRTRADGWLVPNGRTWRLSPRAASGGVRVGGAERLALLEPVARHAQRMALYGRRGASAGAFGVVLHAAGARLSVVLSAAAWRGFSGEGALLRDLANPAAEAEVARARASLTWQQDGGGPGAAAAPAAFAWLALSGSAGFSLTEGRYFRRELPLPRAPLLELQPRLVAARELVGSGAVRWRDGAAEVDTDHATYRVVRDQDGNWSCTCPWFATGRGERGPCKHALAAALLEPGGRG